jgi:hypothetical protein
MSLNRFVTATFADINIASSDTGIARRSDNRWTAVGPTETLIATEDGGVGLSAPKIILRAASDLNSVHFQFPIRDNHGHHLSLGDEITVIPLINITSCDFLTSDYDHFVFAAGNVTSMTKYMPVTFMIVKEPEPDSPDPLERRRTWLVLP